MVKKIIKYDVELLSTTPKWRFEKYKAYTNDLNSVEFQFEITDIADLSGATGSVQLYMRDRSFFQSSDVTIDGNVFKYLLKENEGDHAGAMRIQLVVAVGDKEYATPVYDNVEIVSGLETKVGPEIMVQDWTKLLREARDYIADFVLAEEGREQQFTTAQNARSVAFLESESTRAAQENARKEAETVRVAKEGMRVDAEDARDSSEDERVLNEQQRESQEAERVSLFADMQLVHDLDTGKHHHVQMELYGGKPRLKIEEVLS